jgi:hypothetical protein
MPKRSSIRHNICAQDVVINSFTTSTQSQSIKKEQSMKQYRLMGFVLVIVALFLVGRPLFAQDGATPPTQPGSGMEAAAVSAQMGTAFTYQGDLKQNGAGISANCDFEFSLFDAASAGTQIGSTQTKTNVAISNGLFTIPNLDFGAGAFNGEARWLQIGVRCPAGSGDYTILTPRQALTPAPYALAIPGLFTLQNDTSPNLIGGYAGNSVTEGVVGATISGGGADGDTNRVTDDYSTVGGGTNNQAGNNAGTTFDSRYATVGGGSANIANGNFATVGGGGGNTSSGSAATVGGGSDNIASGYLATVGGGLVNTASGGIATVGGGDGNTANNNYATVSGGSANTASGVTATVGGGSDNTASGLLATVSGGYDNAATGGRSTVGGGSDNTASGSFANIGGGLSNIANHAYATVGGGSSNTASGERSMVGGGWSNTASGSFATVSGGGSNTASGVYSTVPGGLNNVALGNYSFAAGRRAKANSEGAFVWGAGVDADIVSPAANSFSVRAPGGIWLGTTSTPSIPGGTFLNTSTGARLTTGGVWTNGSDRNGKENFTAVNAQSILAQVAALPISTWNYRTEDATVRHIGPMAQDFHAAFGLGANDISIGTVDADGVALAAIQGLHQLTLDQKAEIAALTERLATLEAQAQQNDRLPLSMLIWLALLGIGGVALGLVWRGRRAGGR